MLLVDSTYINNGGGKTLLLFFITELKNRKIDYFILIDERLKDLCFQLSYKNNYEIIEPSEFSRKLFYKKNINKFNKIFCFANVPPPVYMKNKKTFIFFHNTLITSSILQKNNYDLKTKINFFIKRIYIFSKNRHQYNWIVQTKTMKKSLNMNLWIDNKKIHIIPFYDNFNFTNPNYIEREKNSFIYIAEGVSQKNHINLLKAWNILSSKYNYYPKLYLTINISNSKLINLIENLNYKGLKIINLGICDKSTITNLYLKSEFLIYPSISESFGLPLLESINFGCKVIASNLPYVHDIISASDYFNPFNPNEIAEIVFKTTYSDFPNSKILINPNIDHLFNIL